MKKTTLCLIGLLALSACSPTSPTPPEAISAVPQPYVLKNTEVRDIHAQGLNRDCQVFVGLPDDYAEHPDKTYPVLFVTDADYAFPLIRSIARRVGNQGEDLQPFILVGLSYAKGDTGTFSRNRDYTPSKGGQGESANGKPYIYGEAAAYRAFIKDEVFPLIAESYRADMTHKIFSGHSYGGLLGADILLSDPGMFEAYILSSPSLWFDNKVIFAREAAYAQAHKDLSAKVFMATGGYEVVGPDKRNNTTNDLVADMHATEKTLTSRGYPHLKVHSEVIEGEDHLTVAPDIITHGLLWALGTHAR
jgi:predicted alpha/beta superfamily hydrolase